MKNRFLLFLWSALLLSLAASVAAQNTKIIFPTPTDFEGATAHSARATPDGGFILTGRALDNVANDLAILPRVVKLNAALETEWDQLYLGDQTPRAYLRNIGAALPMPDGGYFIGITDDSTDIDLIRLDGSGNLLGTQAYPEFTSGVATLGLLPDGNVLAVRHYYNAGWKTGILHLDDQGGIVLAQPVTGINDNSTVIRLSNGDLLFRHYVSATQKYVLTRTDPYGVQLWQSAPTSGLAGLLTSRPDNGFAISMGSGVDFRIRLFDALGVVTDTTPPLGIPSTAAGLESYPDGSFLVSGSTFSNRGFMLRIQPDGAITWSAESPDDGQPAQHNLIGFPTADGWAIGASEGGFPGNQQFGLLRTQDNTGIAIYLVTGRVARDEDASCTVEPAEAGIGHTQVTATNPLGETWQTFNDANGEYAMYLPAGDYTLTTQTLFPFFNLCPTAPTAVSFPGNPDKRDTVMLPQQSPDLIHRITGKITLDQDDNCTADAGEPALQDWLVRLVVGTQSLILDTDADGIYTTFVTDGTYQIQAIPYNAGYAFCGSSAADISFSSTVPETAVADFVAYPLSDCPVLSASVGIPPIRPCWNATLNVRYRNDGTATSNPATLQITLDPGLGYQSAVPAPFMVDGQTLWFDLGAIPPTASGDFGGQVSIVVSVGCGLPVGNQVCVAAEIAAPSNCNPVPGWNGAITAVTGDCNGDSTTFTIRNIGNATHSQVLDFVIIEDQIVLKQGVFQLPPGGIQLESVLASGIDTAVTIIAQQEPGYPGDTTVTFTVSNCNGNGSHPTGFGGAPGPGSAQSCRIVTASYDPNDKQAFPEGRGANHVVQPGTPLVYTIRFQNTGTDTAFRVVLRDTLPAELDPATVRMEDASHACDLFRFGHLLEFNFENILLPDSTTNLEASQGFVRFTVAPRPALPLGTVVGNRAAIYFDFNEPVITNTVIRTYDELYQLIQTHTSGGEANELKVRIYPNPFSTRAVLELPDDAPEGAYQLVLSDASGRTLATLPLHGRQLTVDGTALSAGVVAWRLLHAGAEMATGRLVVLNR